MLLFRSSPCRSKWNLQVQNKPDVDVVVHNTITETLIADDVGERVLVYWFVFVYIRV